MVDGVVDGKEQGEAEAGEQLGDDDGERDGGKANYLVSGICFNSNCSRMHGHFYCFAWYDLLADVDRDAWSILDTDSGFFTVGERRAVDEKYSLALTGLGYVQVSFIFSCRRIRGIGRKAMVVESVGAM